MELISRIVSLKPFSWHKTVYEVIIPFWYWKGGGSHCSSMEEAVRPTDLKDSGSCEGAV